MHHNDICINRNLNCSDVCITLMYYWLPELSPLEKAMYKNTNPVLSRPSFIIRPFFLLFFLCAAWAPANLAIAQNIGPIYRINAGTDVEAIGDAGTFTGDAYYSENTGVGPIVSNSIANASNDAIYQSERISNASLDPFGYALPVSNGSYTVTLHFAETAFPNMGQRVFNVEIEGVEVLESFDILGTAGAPNTAVQETVLGIQVNDGELNIDFISVVERAKINAIEVSGVIDLVPIPFGINAGGASYASSDLTFSADTGVYFLDEGTPFSNAASIENTQDDVLYNSERFNPTLRFALPGFIKGLYTIQLHFAETNHQTSNQRIFDVTIEGEEVLSNYDIFSEAGGFATAVVEEFPNFPISDGILNITLTRSVGSATINAIAITGATSVANEEFADDELPGTHKLSAAYPNPFNPQTQFSLSVAQTQQIEINIYNLLGQRVKSLYTGLITAKQEQTFAFDAASLPSGIYLIQVRGEQFLETQQVTLLK